MVQGLQNAYGRCGPRAPIPTFVVRSSCSSNTLPRKPSPPVSITQPSLKVSAIRRSFGSFTLFGCGAMVGDGKRGGGGKEQLVRGCLEVGSAAYHPGVPAMPLKGHIYGQKIKSSWGCHFSILRTHQVTLAYALTLSP